MSIEQFGESLLGDIRKRREQESRRLRKQEERNALLGLGIGLAAKIGNERLAAKTNNFLNNQEIWNAELVQKQARQNAASLQGVQSSINKGGQGYQAGDTVGYAMATMRPEFEARAKEKMSDVYTNDLTEYNDLVTAEVQKLAKSWASEYEKAIVLANDIADKDSYEAMVKMNALKAQPSNIGSWITQGISNLFGGKSQEDIQNEALLAITTNGRFAKNAKALNTFMSTYNSTGDMVRAYNFTNQVFPEEAFGPDKKTKIDTTSDVQVVDDKVFAVEKITTTNLITQEKTEEVKTKTDAKGNPVTILDTNDPEATMLALVKEKQSTFNYGIRAQEMLKPKAFEGFMAEANSLNLRPENVRTLDEYDKVGQLYHRWLTGNAKDPTQEARERSLIEVISTGVFDSKVAAEQLQDLPEDEKQRRMMKLLLNLIDTAGAVSETTGRSRTTIPASLDFGTLDRQLFEQEYPFISRQTRD